MEKPLENMTDDELARELEHAQEALDDVEATFNFTLANTNTHLADDNVLGFEQELYEHRDRVEEIKSLMRRRGLLP